MLKQLKNKLTTKRYGKRYCETSLYLHTQIQYFILNFNGSLNFYFPP